MYFVMSVTIGYYIEFKNIYIFNYFVIIYLCLFVVVLCVVWQHNCIR